MDRGRGWHGVGVKILGGGGDKRLDRRVFLQANDSVNWLSYT